MSDKPILFISDLHLEPGRPDISQAFFSFLDAFAVKAQALYILGDFFNLWLGDDHVTELSTQIAGKLHALSNAGVAIKLMHGNRDFLMGESFAQSCGAELIQEPYLLDAFDQQILLLHGDVLCTRDHDYMSFRQMVRDPKWQQEFLSRPIDERIEFATKARKQSQSMSSNKAADIMDVTPADVTKTMLKHNIITLIHGHTHRPAVHEHPKVYESAVRMVLGDWDDGGWYISWTPEQLFLHKIDSPVISDGNSSLK
ncbi:UDP-2,3-diacylglucosamine diphosphatase [Haliea sp. AH-315-K21]|uniref:UDP-2,3-diacylglucosamine hydrolase n=1 Tax=SAR86 cluster bacterium TaxID=2030880 RepID=A0A2A5C976_9GAMM|nr:UDP-2,3-diacylglucosamine diphosphatase [Haliea sp. AH-315-K21]PCJ40000.1 MAG: UDP-2,3-diacylglucosamine diphosphatase [SAR86 cluster bacterium]